MIKVQKTIEIWLKKLIPLKNHQNFYKYSKNVLKLLWTPKSHLKFSKIPLKILTFYLKTPLQSHPHPINIVNFIKHPPFHSLSKIDIDSDKHKKKAMNANFIATFSSLLLHFISSNVNWHLETMFSLASVEKVCIFNMILSCYIVQWFIACILHAKGFYWQF